MPVTVCEVCGAPVERMFRPVAGAVQGVGLLLDRLRHFRGGGGDDGSPRAPRTSRRRRRTRAGGRGLEAGQFLLQLLVGLLVGGLRVEAQARTETGVWRCRAVAGEAQAQTIGQFGAGPADQGVASGGDRRAPSREGGGRRDPRQRDRGPGGARRLRARATPDGMRIWLVRDLNPDGAAAGDPPERRGVDLNRNFPAAWRRVRPTTGPRPLSEPESRLAARSSAGVNPDVTIWYHQALTLVDSAPWPTRRSVGATRASRGCPRGASGSSQAWPRDGRTGVPRSERVRGRAGRRRAQRDGGRAQRAGSAGGCADGSQGRAAPGRSASGGSRSGPSASATCAATRSVTTASTTSG